MGKMMSANGRTPSKKKIEEQKIKKVSKPRKPKGMPATVEITSFMRFPKHVSKKEILAKNVVDDDGMTINGEITRAEKISVTESGDNLWRVYVDIDTNNKYGQAMYKTMKGRSNK